MRPSKTIENVRVAMQNRFIEVRFKSLRWKATSKVNDERVFLRQNQ